jgi:hypothetical protein
MDENQQLMMQLDRLEKFAVEHANEKGVAIHYYDAHGKYPCLQVSCDKYLFEMNYRPQEVIEKNEIRTNIFYYYRDKRGIQNSKCFMIKKDAVPTGLEIFARSRNDYHFMPVSYSNWANKMIFAVNWIRNHHDSFLKLCMISSPYNEDGSHKFKFWKNYAKVEIVRQGDDQLVQGIKGGETPSGAHVVGGNGSFMVYNKGVYGLQYTVERVAGEKPRRGYPTFVEMDDYLRQLRDKLGYARKMPKDLLNSKLPNKIEVITYEMDKDPDEREFIPVGYGGDWLNFVKECFKDL